MNISHNNTTSDNMKNNLCFNTFDIHIGRSLQHQIYGLVGFMAVFNRKFNKKSDVTVQKGVQYWGPQFGVWYTHQFYPYYRLDLDD